MVALTVLTFVPGLTLAAILDGAGSGAVRLLLLIVVWTLAAAAIASCVRWIFDAHRWRMFGGRGIVLTNVAVATRGVGLGRELLDEVTRAADEAGCTLLLTVRTSNVSAIGLYRSSGFVEESAVGVRAGQVAMVRPPERAGDPGVLGLTDTPVPRLVVIAWLATTVLVLTAATSSSWPTRIAVVCASLLLCLAALVDVKIQRLPNRLIAGAAVFVALAAYLGGSPDSALLAAGIGTAPFLLTHLLDPSAIGFGDVKFAAVAGALAATWWVPAAAIMVLVAVGIAGVARLLRPSGPLPFGPSLHAGTLAVIAASIVIVERGLVT